MTGWTLTHSQEAAIGRNAYLGTENYLRVVGLDSERIRVMTRWNLATQLRSLVAHSSSYSGRRFLPPTPSRSWTHGTAAYPRRPEPSKWSRPTTGSIQQRVAMLW